MLQCVRRTDLCRALNPFCSPKVFVPRMMSSFGAPHTVDGKVAYVNSLLTAKEESGKTFDQIAEETGLTNAYVAQLFHGQAQLKPGTVESLRKAVPALTEKQLKELQKAPIRSFDTAILQEPLVYRLYEAVGHYGHAIKALVNEKFGDGIMSAIDMYATVDKVKGKHGEDRVVITLNGKFLPHVEQKAEDNTASVVQK